MPVVRFGLSPEVQSVLKTPLKAVETAHCAECGVTTTSWEERKVVNRSLQIVPCKRDYWPITFVISLKPGTRTTYIVTPELEAALKAYPFVRLRAMNGGALDYTLDVSLPRDGNIANLLHVDDRIAEWHTNTSAPVCDHHVNFVDKRW